jgi:hypothetical protein
MIARVFQISLLAGATGLSALSGAHPRDVKAEEREEKANTLLTDLLARCKKMHQQQVALNDKIKSLHAAIECHPDKKPRAQDRQAALKLASDAKVLVTAAADIVNTLEADGTAVAFPESFQQLRKDIKHVQNRLEEFKVGRQTQAIGADIAVQLKEMTEALNSR